MKVYENISIDMLNLPGCIKVAIKFKILKSNMNIKNIKMKGC